MRERLWPKDQMGWRPPPAWTLGMYPAAQAAYRQYLDTPLVWPSIDWTAIEELVRLHFAALNQAERPVRWFESFGAAHRYLSGKALEAIERRAEDFLIEAPEGEDPEKIDHDLYVARRAVRGHSWYMAAERASCAAGQPVSSRVMGRWFPPISWNTTRLPDARETALGTCLKAAIGLEPDTRPSAPGGAAWKTAKDAVNESIASAEIWAYTSIVYEHAASDSEAQGEAAVSGRAAWSAIRRAFAAGLWCFWVRDEEVVAVPAPNLYTNSQGKLDRRGGPAVEWPGEAYWFVDGLRWAREIVQALQPPSARKPHVGLRIGAAVLALALLGLNVYLSRNLAGQVLAVTIAPFMVLPLGSERRDLRTLSSLAAVMPLWALADVAWRLHRSGQLSIVEIAATSIVLAASLFLSCLGAFILWARVVFGRS